MSRVIIENHGAAVSAEVVREDDVVRVVLRPLAEAKAGEHSARIRTVLEAVNSSLKQDLVAGKGVWAEAQRKYGWRTKRGLG